MKAIVTGSWGTIGTVLSARLADSGWGVIPWNRAEVPIDDYDAMDAFVERVRPDVLFHLAAASNPTRPNDEAAEAWQVNYEWTSELAWITRQRNVRFVFTSSVLVFTDAAPGPYTIAAAPDAAEGMAVRSAEPRSASSFRIRVPASLASAGRSVRASRATR